MTQRYVKIACLSIVKNIIQTVLPQSIYVGKRMKVIGGQTRKCIKALQFSELMGDFKMNRLAVIERIIGQKIYVPENYCLLGKSGKVISDLERMIDQGKTCFMLPIGTVFNWDNKKMRERLIEEERITAIILLPAGMLEVSIQSAVWILDGNDGEIAWLDLRQPAIDQKSNTFSCLNHISSFDDLWQTINAKEKQDKNWILQQTKMLLDQLQKEL